MLKCLKDVGVRSSHFDKQIKEPVVSVKAGDVVEVKDSSVQALIDSGYFELSEKKSRKHKEEVAEVEEVFEVEATVDYEELVSEE